MNETATQPVSAGTGCVAVSTIVTGSLLFRQLRNRSQHFLNPALLQLSRTKGEIGYYLLLDRKLDGHVGVAAHVIARRAPRSSKTASGTVATV